MSERISQKTKKITPKIIVGFFMLLFIASELLYDGFPFLIDTPSNQILREFTKASYGKGNALSADISKILTPMIPTEKHRAFDLLETAGFDLIDFTGKRNFKNKKGNIVFLARKNANLFWNFYSGNYSVILFLQDETVLFIQANVSG